MNTIVYSHGFGVTKEDGTLFSDIAAGFSDTTNILFDYNDIDIDANTIRVPPLDEQAKTLALVVAAQNSDIDIIAHSQGCIVAAMIPRDRVQSITMIAPPTDVDFERLVAYFGRNPRSVIDPAGESTIVRRDGTTTIVPPGYWQSLKTLNLLSMYEAVSTDTQLTIFRALNDEVLGQTTFGPLLNDYVISYATDHNFRGADERTQLVRDVQARLA